MTTDELRRVVPGPFDDVLARVPDALKTEGFGVLTEIDVQKTLAAKLGVEWRRYRILGACNPGFAHQALQHDPEIGVMLPCNVIVYEQDDGAVVVKAIDPMATMAARDPGLAPIAATVRSKLAAALSHLAG